MAPLTHSETKTALSIEDVYEMMKKERGWREREKLKRLLVVEAATSKAVEAIGSSHCREEAAGQIQREDIKGGLSSEMTIGGSSVPSTLIGLPQDSLHPKDKFGIQSRGSPIQRPNSQA